MKKVVLHPFDVTEEFTDAELVEMKLKDIDAILTNPEGPGGGNPEYCIIGPKDVLINYLIDGMNYCSTREEVIESWPELG